MPKPPVSATHRIPFFVEPVRESGPRGHSRIEFHVDRLGFDVDADVLNARLLAKSVLYGVPAMFARNIRCY
jgi:hypothetical protein